MHVTLTHNTNPAVSQSHTVTSPPLISTAVVSSLWKATQLTSVSQTPAHQLSRDIYSHPPYPLVGPPRKPSHPLLPHWAYTVLTSNGRDPHSLQTSI